MSPLTKAFVVLTTLLSVVMVSLTVAHVARTEDYREQFNAMKIDRDAAVARAAQEQAKVANDLAAARAEDANQESELADVRGDLTDLRGDLRSKDERIAGLESNLARMTAANTALSATLTSATQRLEAQDEQIRTLISGTGDLARQKGELEQEIAVALAARDRYANEVRRLTEQLIAAQTANRALTDDNERLAGVVESLMPDADVTTVTVPDIRIEGSVTKIDQIGTGLTLIELNVGTRDGVTRDMAFSISRGQQYIGTIRITTVDTDMAVGELTLNPGGEVRRGDTAVTGQRR